MVYDDYFIIHLTNFDSEKTFEMMGLYARKPDGSPELKKNFKTICRKYGISEENVLDLTKVDRCLQVRENQVAQDSSAE
ncbi:salivary lipocalin-like [Rousettus aegyptiacus]|uniref:salivary lipocalin-like n=1 Tax=Rousettus aegyptiacus TaxID=9407 RepID=UPI00168CAD3C|nr:salivary lipocalin-like [Rousettus aegyptiacus]